MPSNQIRQAVAYLRTNDGSAEKLAAQRASITAWASRAETEVVGWHLDCVSANAALPCRPGLCEAMQDLEAGRAAVLIVASPQLLTRSVSQTLAFLRRLHGMGAEVESADVGGSTWQGLFVLGAEVSV